MTRIKTIPIQVSLMFLLVACSPVETSSLSRPQGAVGDRVAGDTDPHSTGLIPPTPEQEAWLVANAIEPTDIFPNRLALDRMRAAYKGRGLVPLPDSQIVAAWRGQASPRGLALAVPVMVDNSELPAFPPIRSQGSLGSCASFSTTYYQWTHMVALAYGWDAKNGGDDYRMSPKWTYNFVNDGENAGSTSWAPFNVLEDQGCATWAQFPYNGANNPVNYRPWCMETDTWRSALRYRLDQRGSVYGIDRLEGLQGLKQMLANGFVLHLSTYINSWQFLAGGVPDDPTTTEDDPYVGQSVCHWMNGNNGPHGMTVVGYNDAIWVDVNGDGQVDEGEKGALKIANSWGSGWHSGGFTWIAYDALRDVSRVPGAPEAGRRGAFNSAIWATVRQDYQAVMTGEFTLTHALRDQLQVTLGIGETSDVEPTLRFYPSALSYNGGPYAFDGTLSPVAFTFVLDFSDIVEPEGIPQRYFLGVRDRTAGDPGDLTDFKLADGINGLEAWAANVPQTVDDDSIYAWVDFNFTSTNTAPSLSAIADQLIGINTDTGPVAFSVADAESAPGDLALRAVTGNSSLVSVPDIVFGGSGTDRTVTVTPLPYRTGSAQVTIHLTDGVDTSSETFVVHVSATGNTPPTISPLSDQTTQAGVATAAIPLSIGDAETAADDLEVQVQGSLLGYELTGSGNDRLLHICPYPFDLGEQAILVRVSDGELSSEAGFVLTVQAGPVNTPPTIGSIPDQVTDSGVPTGPIPFTIGDNETDPAFLQPMFDSDNWQLFRFNGVVFGGSGANRTISLCPAGGEHGSATITLRVWDGELEAQTQFQITVNDTGNTQPVLSPIPDQHIPINGTTGPIAFSLTDSETPAQVFELSWGNDNWDLIPWSGLAFGGQGENRTIQATPYLGESGSATITVQVTDGAFVVTEEFTVIVDPGLLCGNGVLDAGETCDPPDTCPQSCVDGDVCTSDTMIGSPAGCDAACSNDPILTCTSGDGCCPAGCDSLQDTDCPVVCDNGVLEAGETCDPIASCPVDCNDMDSCTLDSMAGTPQTCDVVCSQTPILVCLAGDACCPAGCNSLDDADCPVVCDNGVLEAGETCDPIASCPVARNDADTCTADSLLGSAQTCDALCNHDPILSCAAGDGCCPAGCDSTLDADCPVVCGNGVIETGETCDPPDACPASCDDANPCTTDSLAGAPASCDAVCSNAAMDACVDSDGCCPAGCTNELDTDCSATCGDGVLDEGETCDPPETCPASCDDADTCTNDTSTGSPQNCNLLCNHQAVSACQDGDACCPAGCHGGTDNDCPEDCGNGQLDAGETCDPPATCPATCDDADPCTADTSTGSAQTCDLVCDHASIQACMSGDACCPAGCSAPGDDDCPTEPPDPLDPPPRVEGGCACTSPGASRADKSLLLLLVFLLWTRRRNQIPTQA